MTNVDNPGSVEHVDTSVALEALADAFERRDPQAIAALFHEDGAWRDILAFTWHLRTAIGPEAIAATMAATMDRVGPSGLALIEGTAPRRVRRAGRDVIEGLLEFETSVGPCRGVVRWVETGDGQQIWSLSTSLEEIRGHEELVKRSIDEHREGFGGPNWLDLRTERAKFEDRDPDVLIVGGGQCGLGLAARLGQRELDTLVVDRQDRVGDSWRSRYHSLVLHNRTSIAHFPYMRFPDTFRMWLAKDKIANWMESYAEAMDLNVWTSTTFESATFDEASGRWNVVLHTNGGERKIRPRHIVMATGVSGRPSVPDLPGLEDFGGEVIHSVGYKQGAPYAGKHAVIIGIGNSAHDVAQDLHGAGAEAVTMFQRGPTTVVGVESGNIVYEIFNEGMPLDHTDLVLTGTPYPGVVDGFKEVVEYCEDADAALQTGLAAAGMKLDWGYDRTGFQMKYFRRGGGYYLNVGCSELIMNGDVGLRDFAEFDRIVAEGVQLTDGSVVRADVIVFATGYHSLSDLIQKMYGEEVAEKVGPIWGWDDEGEMANMYKRTGQENLWFHAGSLAQSRIMSKFLALQIKAREIGLIDAEPPDRVVAALNTPNER